MHGFIRYDVHRYESNAYRFEEEQTFVNRVKGSNPKLYTRVSLFTIAGSVSSVEKVAAIRRLGSRWVMRGRTRASSHLRFSPPWSLGIAGDERFRRIINDTTRQIVRRVSLAWSNRWMRKQTMGTEDTGPWGDQEAGTPGCLITNIPLLPRGPWESCPRQRGLFLLIYHFAF